MNKLDRTVLWKSGHKLVLAAILAIQFAIAYVIGTGGVIINSDNIDKILRKTTNILHNPQELRPAHPKFMVDQKYIMAAMGLLSQKEPLLALKILKKYTVKIRGKANGLKK